jgi:beta-glucosidase-like glycosyl hydrolase
VCDKPRRGRCGRFRRGRFPLRPPPCPGASGQKPLYLDTSYSFAERAADLVSCMTLTQKIAQLHTNSAPAIPSLGLQQYTYSSEGLHGVDRLGADTNSDGASASGVHATSFPANFAATMTWDPKLMYQESTAIADEARGFLDKKLWGKGQNNLGPSASDYGDLTYFAPTVNLDRDPPSTTRCTTSKATGWRTPPTTGPAWPCRATTSR